MARSTRPRRGRSISRPTISLDACDERRELRQFLRIGIGDDRRALAAASPFDVASSDRHTVKPWFAGRVAQSPSVRDFADAGFPLAGGRVDYVGGTRVPVLVYRHGQHVIDVYVLPPGAPALVTQRRERGYSIAPATLGGEHAAIVSDADPQELAKFAALVAGAE